MEERKAKIITVNFAGDPHRGRELERHLVIATVLNPDNFHSAIENFRHMLYYYSTIFKNCGCCFYSKPVHGVGIIGKPKKVYRAIEENPTESFGLLRYYIGRYVNSKELVFYQKKDSRGWVESGWREGKRHEFGQPYTAIIPPSAFDCAAKTFSELGCRIERVDRGDLTVPPRQSVYVGNGWGGVIYGNQ